MARRAILLLALAALLVGVGGVAVARSTPALSTSGPISVGGTEATTTFTIADRTVRQIRYADGGTLRYTFQLANDGRLPVTVLGLLEDQPDPRLFAFVGLTGPDGEDRVQIGAGESAEVTLALAMGGCETLSARAGSFVTDVALRTERAGLFADAVTVRLPEEIHTGSPREAFCPESTATSRPPG